MLLVQKKEIRRNSNIHHTHTQKVRLMQNHFCNIRFEEIHGRTPPERMNGMRLGRQIHSEEYWRRLHVGGATDAGMRETFVRHVDIYDILDTFQDEFTATNMQMSILCGLSYNNRGIENPAMLTNNGRVSGELSVERCRELTTEAALTGDGNETAGYMMQVTRVLNGVARWANWRFKYYLVMCSFEDTAIIGITPSNHLNRERLTRRELEMMIMVVWTYDTTEWESLYHIMSYFEECVFGEIMTNINKVLKGDRRTEFEDDMEYLQEHYFDPYVTPMYHRLLREGGYVDAA